MVSKIHSDVALPTPRQASSGGCKPTMAMPHRYGFLTTTRSSTCRFGPMLRRSSTSCTAPTIWPSCAAGGSGSKFPPNPFWSCGGYPPDISRASRRPVTGWFICVNTDLPRTPSACVITIRRQPIETAPTRRDSAAYGLDPAFVRLKLARYAAGAQAQMTTSPGWRTDLFKVSEH